MGHNNRRRSTAQGGFDLGALQDPAEMRRLTDLTDCGGCAAKLDADSLRALLSPLLGATDEPNVLSGLRSPDDAAAYRMEGGIAVLATVDFFPPIVDDPYTYGAIAAANATSDIFAMGGRVLFGLNVAAIPSSVPLDVARQIFAGGQDTFRRAGGTILGGHTLRDPGPMYGLVVIGSAQPEQLMLKRLALPGDVLLLTKELGTGFVISALRGGAVDPGLHAAAVASMTRLNRGAAAVLTRAGVRAATDITGFGLLGHAAEVAKASSVEVVIDLDALPSLPGVANLIGKGIRTTGSRLNKRFIEPYLNTNPTAESVEFALALDPQTSGGLLAAVAPDKVESVTRDLLSRGDGAWRVGHVEAGSGISFAK